MFNAEFRVQRCAWSHRIYPVRLHNLKEVKCFCCVFVCVCVRLCVTPKLIHFLRTKTSCSLHLEKLDNTQPALCTSGYGKPSWIENPHFLWVFLACKTLYNSLKFYNFFPCQLEHFLLQFYYVKGNDCLAMFRSGLAPLCSMWASGE